MLLSRSQLLYERRLFVNHIAFLNQRILFSDRNAQFTPCRRYAASNKKLNGKKRAEQSAKPGLGLAVVPEKPKLPIPRPLPPPRRPQPVRIFPEQEPERRSYVRPIIAKWVDGTPPPKFYIDLDRPPKERWSETLKWGTETLRRVLLNPVYTTDADIAYYFGKGLGILRALERRYYFSNEQYEEMRGIAQLADVPFDKLYYFNHFINSRFSCTSGTVPSSETGNLLHFRTLECGIGLPELLMEAHYVRNGQVIAKAIHHFGHVCFATGVRKGLSLSLNSNLVYNIGRIAEDTVSLHRLLFHDPWTIVTRNLLLSRECPSLSQAVRGMEAGFPRTVFPVFCNGSEATSLGYDDYDEMTPAVLTVSEKHRSIVIGNHFDLPPQPPGALDLNEMLFHVNKEASIHRTESEKRVQAMEQYILRALERPGSTGVTVKELSGWLTRTPVKNRATLMTCIMDPTQGDILWSAAYQVT